MTHKVKYLVLCIQPYKTMCNTCDSVNDEKKHTHPNTVLYVKGRESSLDL